MLTEIRTRVLSGERLEGTAGFESMAVSIALARCASLQPGPMAKIAFSSPTRLARLRLDIAPARAACRPSIWRGSQTDRDEGNAPAALNLLAQRIAATTSACWSAVSASTTFLILPGPAG